MPIDRSRYQKAYQQLSEFNSDALQLLAKAEVAYKMAIDGYETETVSPATGEVITLMAKAPAVAIQALQFQNTVAKFIIEQLEKEESKGTTEDRTLVINLKELT